jgi:nitric oxide reductase large subunit
MHMSVCSCVHAHACFFCVYAITTMMMMMDHHGGKHDGDDEYVDDKYVDDTMIIMYNVKIIVKTKFSLLIMCMHQI